MKKIIFMVETSSFMIIRSSWCVRRAWKRKWKAKVSKIRKIHAQKLQGANNHKLLLRNRSFSKCSVGNRTRPQAHQNFKVIYKTAALQRYCQQTDHLVNDRARQISRWSVLVTTLSSPRFQAFVTKPDIDLWIYSLSRIIFNFFECSGDAVCSIDLLGRLRLRWSNEQISNLCAFKDAEIRRMKYTKNIYMCIYIYKISEIKYLLQEETNFFSLKFYFSISAHRNVKLHKNRQSNDEAIFTEISK